MDTQITLRKRKKPDNCECQCSDDLEEMRSEISRISSLLEKYVGSNEQVLLAIQDNIADIKSQITDMKSSNEQTITIMQTNVDKVITEINYVKLSTSSMLSEQKDIKNHVTRLEQSISQGENKLKSLESDLNNLKTPPIKPEKLSEQLIQEIQNRNNRQKNIIVVGLPEPTLSKSEERLAKDEADIMNLIFAMDNDIPKPIKIFRIGKPHPGKNRNIKVCFDVTGPAKQLLRNKNKLPEGIKIFSDQTPAQQNYLKCLQDELRQRENNGESGITIKYLNGTPTIVKSDTKNYQRHMTS